jgi:hypothetical protein
MIRARLFHGVPVLGALALASCTRKPHYEINAPVSGASIVCTDAAGVSCEVPVNVTWEGVALQSRPEATFDGVVLVDPFTNACCVATMITGVGRHTFGVSGDLWANKFNSLSRYSATSTFTITPQPPVPPPTGGFSLSASPSALAVERGTSTTAKITVTRRAPFAGAVTVVASAPPTGVTVTSLTVGAGMTSDVVSIATSPAAAIGKVTLDLKGTSSGTLKSATSVVVTIGRESGAFMEANPTPYVSTLPSTVHALAGAFHVDISAGSPSLPQARKAAFFRGSGGVGGDIGFTLGPGSNLGGAGFCNNSSPAALTRGVVLSGQLPGFSSQNVVTLLDLTANSPGLVEIPVDMRVQQTTGGPFIQFNPRVFFSRDCTLALVAGVNPLGPSMHILRVFDLVTGRPIGPEVSFDTPAFSALVRTVGTKQEVEVKVDAGASSAQTIVIAIP